MKGSRHDSALGPRLRARVAPDKTHTGRAQPALLPSCCPRPWSNPDRRLSIGGIRAKGRAL